MRACRVCLLGCLSTAGVGQAENMSAIPLIKLRVRVWTLLRTSFASLPSSRINLMVP